MSTQPVVHPRSSANGFGRRKADREFGSRLDNKSQIGKINSNRLTSTGPLTGNKGGGYEIPSRERLFYVSTCLIGHPVEVQVLDGSVFSGIFHAMNFDKTSGIILKMARLVKFGSSRGHKNMPDPVSKPPSKTLIIQSKELVQIMAKGVSVTRDELTNEIQSERHQDIITDSSISQSRHVEVERELERWVPDEENPECPELENIFDGPWNRGWDQFEANETLFGVKSTFNEEFYTTKLERGPQTRELEREASRIAREIEGEDTLDLHLAEERGIQFHDHFDIDEETRFSSVFRGVDASGHDDTEDILLDSRNFDTFGGLSDSITSLSFTDLTSGKNNNEAPASSSTSSMDEVLSSQSGIGRDPYHSGYSNHATRPSSECVSKSIPAWDVESRIQDSQLSDQYAGSTYTKEEGEKQKLGEEAQTLKSEESSLRTKKNIDKGGLSPNASAYAPSSVAPKDQEKGSPPCEPSEGAASVKAQGTTQSLNPRARPGSSASSTLDWGGAVTTSSGAGLSPSSSVGSLSSEKSMLNPHAKEFKLNPNAKSFIPSQTPLRPASPVPDGSFYYPTSMAAVPHMHGLPVGIGIGPTFTGHQPVMFNPQAAPVQSPQPYFSTNGPQYGQQMILGHPRQVVYMPTYPPDMPYKGREF